MTAPPVIEVRGVTKAFGEVPVLRGIDLVVPEHGAVALIGASGSGKSTLLRCIDLLEPIDDGDVLLDGAVVTDPSVEPVAVRRSLGMVFQAFNLFPHLTALENVALAPVRAQGLGRAEARERAAELLARFGLAGREGERPDNLSGGQQQRVAIARALVQNPEIILADEPIASLDPRNTKIVMDALLRINKHFGITVVCNLHSLDLARSYCDRLIGMATGRIVFDDVPAALTAQIARELYDLEADEVMDKVHPAPAAIPALGEAAVA